MIVQLAGEAFRNIVGARLRALVHGRGAPLGEVDGIGSAAGVTCALGVWSG